jgi:pimeloyl-ACP methyl ester carboxylesterase
MDQSPHRSNFVNVNGIRLHYLDWGGTGPALLFIPGMGCSAYIFSKFGPRFTDKFRVLAFDRRGHGDSDYPETGYDADTLAEDLCQFLAALAIDQVILAGHSLAYLELSRFAVLYPERVLKLVFLDAVYYRSSPEAKTIWAQNPMPKIMPAWPKEDPDTLEEYIAIVKRLFPSLAVIWDEVMDEQTRHTVKINPEGKVVDKMSEALSKVILDMTHEYAPEYSKIRAPILSFHVIRNSSDFLSPEYMTEEQKAQVIDYFENVLKPFNAQYLEQFRREVPHAKIVEIPNGHHYCFMKHEELVFNEMRTFLLE